MKLGRVHVGVLVPNPSDLYPSFIAYKRTPGRPDTASLERVTAILSGAVEQHLDEISTELGGAPTVVAPVPSTKVAADVQPLLKVLGSVAAIKGIAEPVLKHTGLPRVTRTVQAGLFEARAGLSGERVLLIEDLWVRGTTAASAVLALRDAGCEVSILAIGREVRQDYLSCSELLDATGLPAWW